MRSPECMTATEATLGHPSLPPIVLVFPSGVIWPGQSNYKCINPLIQRFCLQKSILPVRENRKPTRLFPAPPCQRHQHATRGRARQWWEGLGEGALCGLPWSSLQAV